MCLIAGNVDDELLAKLFVRKPLPGSLYFHDDKLILEKKVNAGSPAGVGRCPFLIPDIVKIESKQAVDQILDIILILDLQGLTVRMASSQLPSH